MDRCEAANAADDFTPFGGEERYGFVINEGNGLPICQSDCVENALALSICSTEENTKAFEVDIDAASVEKT
jgi:hypothetical protein